MSMHPGHCCSHIRWPSRNSFNTILSPKPRQPFLFSRPTTTSPLRPSNAGPKVPDTQAISYLFLFMLSPSLLFLNFPFFFILHLSAVVLFAFYCPFSSFILHFYSINSPAGQFKHKALVVFRKSTFVQFNSHLLYETQQYSLNYPHHAILKDHSCRRGALLLYCLCPGCQSPCGLGLRHDQHSHLLSQQPRR